LIPHFFIQLFFISISNPTRDWYKQIHTNVPTKQN
jgi:hypothetical protein